MGEEEENIIPILQGGRLALNWVWVSPLANPSSSSNCMDDILAVVCSGGDSQVGMRGNRKGVGLMGYLENGDMGTHGGVQHKGTSWGWFSGRTGRARVGGRYGHRRGR